MIREAQISDIPKLVNMGRDFYDLVSLSVEYDPESVKATMEQLIMSENGVIFVDENLTGAIGGLVYPHHFNKNALTGGELFWFVEKNERGSGYELLKRFEEWVKEKKATTIQMIALEDYKPSLVGRFYKRKGYKPLEHTYMKAV